MKTILIVDDDRELRDLATHKLEADGFAVRVAENGSEALTIVRNYPVDLILLDLMMPGMDGNAFVHELTEKLGKGIPVIILTNLESSSYPSSVREFLVKSRTTLNQIAESCRKQLRDK